jgi:hypothetical protein
MPAGFQSFNDYGSFQLDSEYRTLSVSRKGTVQSGARDRGNPHSLAYIYANPGDLIAIHTRGEAVSLVARTTDSNNVYAIYNREYALIDYWVFRPHEWSGQNNGIQIFDGAGNLTYDSGRAPLNIAGWAGNPGTYNLNPNRQYAVIPTVLYSHMEQTIIYTDVGASPDYMLFQIASTDFARTYGNAVVTERFEYFHYAYGPYKANSGQGGWFQPGVWSNNQNSQLIIVDVTGI